MVVFHGGDKVCTSKAYYRGHLGLLNIRRGFLSEGAKTASALPERKDRQKRNCPRGHRKPRLVTAESPNKGALNQSLHH